MHIIKPQTFVLKHHSPCVSIHACLFSGAIAIASTDSITVFATNMDNSVLSATRLLDISASVTGIFAVSLCADMLAYATSLSVHVMQLHLTFDADAQSATENETVILEFMDNGDVLGVENSGMVLYLASLASTKPDILFGPYS
jgi:hypothetical protein